MLAVAAMSEKKRLPIVKYSVVQPILIKFIVAAVWLYNQFEDQDRTIPQVTYACIDGAS